MQFRKEIKIKKTNTVMVDKLTLLVHIYTLNVMTKIKIKQLLPKGFYLIISHSKFDDTLQIFHIWLKIYILCDALFSYGCLNSNLIWKILILFNAFGLLSRIYRILQQQQINYEKSKDCFETETITIKTK